MSFEMEASTIALLLRGRPKKQAEDKGDSKKLDADSSEEENLPPAKVAKGKALKKVLSMINLAHEGMLSSGKAS